jgi:hypothetical protein
MIILFLGCQDQETAYQSPSNNPWTIRAKSRIEMQEQRNTDEQYVRNFIANENRYYTSDHPEDWQQTVVIETHIAEEEIIR